MGNTIKQFNYQITKRDKADRLPFNPHVEIVLDNWVKTDDGVPIISPHLMSDSEIDWHIQQLKTDLDAVGKKAKAALSRAQTDIKSVTENRGVRPG